MGRQSRKWKRMNELSRRKYNCDTKSEQGADLPADKSKVENVSMRVESDVGSDPHCDEPHENVNSACTLSPGSDDIVDESKLEREPMNVIIDDDADRTQNDEPSMSGTSNSMPDDCIIIEGQNFKALQVTEYLPNVSSIPEFVFRPPYKEDMKEMCSKLGTTFGDFPYILTSAVQYRGRTLKLSENVVCQPISGGGACLFKSVSYILSGTEMYHLDLRKRLYHFENAHPNSVKPHLHLTEQVPDPQSKTGFKTVAKVPNDKDVSDHIENLSKANTWGQTVDILALAAMLDVNIFILTPKDPTNRPDEDYQWMFYTPNMFCPQVQTSNQTNISFFIKHSRACHFDVVTQVKTPAIESRAYRKYSRRLATMRERRRTELSIESPEAKRQRNKRARISMSRSRENESVEETCKRLEKDRQSKSRSRQMQTPEEKSRKNMENCARTARSRAHESPNATARRLFANSQAKKNKRKARTSCSKRIQNEMDRLRKRRSREANSADLEKTLHEVRGHIENNTHNVYVCVSDLRYHCRSTVVQLKLSDPISTEHATANVTQSQRGSLQRPLRPQKRQNYDVKSLESETATEEERRLKDERLREMCVMTEATKSFDGLFYICKSCKRCIEGGNTPKCNEKTRGFRVPELPIHLKCDPLNKTEAHILKLIQPFVRVCHIPKSTEFKISGPLICVESEIDQAIGKILPIDQELIPVCFKRKLSFKGNFSQEIVDKAKILRYFEYFKENNHLYTDVELGEQQLDEVLASVMNEIRKQDDWKTEVDESARRSNESSETTHEPPTDDIASYIRALLDDIVDDIETKSDSESDYETTDAGFTTTGELDTIDDDTEDENSKYDLPEYLTEMSDDTIIDDLSKRKHRGGVITTFANAIVEEEERDMNIRKRQQSKKIAAVNMAPSDTGDFVNWSEKDEEVKYMEERAFPHLFPTGRGGYLSTYVNRDSYDDKNRRRSVNFAQYIKQRIEGLDPRFREDTTYMFFLFLVKEQVQITRSICTFFRRSRVDRRQFDVKFFRDADKDEIQRADLGYNVFQQVRGTPPYFKQMQLKLKAQIRQLGSPHLFLTMSAAESRWEELLLNLLQKERKCKVSIDEVKKLPRSEIYKLLTRNVVDVTAHFSSRMRTIYNSLKEKSVILSNYKAVDYFFRTEWQARGAPHIHSLLWLEDDNGVQPPTYDGSRESKEKCEAFIDAVISARQYPEWDDPTGHVTAFQTHSHTFTCRKKGIKIRIRKNEGHGKHDDTKTARELMLDCCRFQFPMFPIRETTIVERPKSDESEKLIGKWKKDYLKARKFILRQTADRSESLTPFDDLTFDEFLDELGMSENEYLDCLKMTARSRKSGAQVFLQRDCCDVFTNNYNANLLRLNQANMDIQFVLDEYACCAYILGYITKNESGLSRLLHEIDVECRKYGHGPDEKIKKFGRALDNGREVSRSEVVYRMLGLHFCESTRTHQFIQASHPKNRDGILKDRRTLEELDDEDNPFHNSAFDYYINRPDSRPDESDFPDFDRMSLAEFIRDYRVAYESKEERNRRQLYDADAEVISDRNSEGKFYTLKNGKGRIRKNRKDTIVRYYFPRTETDIKRSQLVLFHPFRDEMAEIHECPNKTIDELYTQYKDEIEIVRGLFEPNRQSMVNLEDAMEAYDQEREDVSDIDDELLCPEENDHLNEDMEHEETTSESDLAHFISLANKNKAKEIDVTKRQEVCSMIRKLNRDQRRIFDDLIEKLMTYSADESNPLNVYISGRAGTGKSFLTKVLIEASKLIFMKSGNDLDKPTVLVMCPTATAANIVGGETIEAALQMFHSKDAESPHIFGNKHEMACKYSQLKAIFIDEISMVGANKFHQIHKILQGLFKEHDKPFGGIPVICSGDFLQLPPVFDPWIFMPNTNCEARDAKINKWKSYFKMYKLTEKMRSLNDVDFSNLCDRIGMNELTAADIDTLRARITPCDEENSNDVFKEGKLAIIVKDNKTRETINLDKLMMIPSDPITFQARDIPIDITKAYNADNVSRMSYTDCAGLPQSLTVKVDAPVMLTVNLAKLQGLTNGTRGYIVQIDSEKQLIWVKFPGIVGAKNAAIGRRKYNFKGPHGAVPIEKMTSKFSTKGTWGKVWIKRTQFPLVLSYAITSHKSQGLTLEKVIIDFSGRSSYGANPGSFYVAATRVKQLDHLYLRAFDAGMIQTNEQVKEELDSLEKPIRRYILAKTPLDDGLFTFQRTADNDEVKLCYLNINGLFEGSHNLDLDSDLNLTSADFICLSETKIGIETDDDDLDMSRMDFLGRLDNRHSSMGMVVLERRDRSGSGYELVSQYHYPDQCQIMRCRINVYNSHTFHVVFVYIHPDHVPFGFQKLSKIIQRGDILMGDLNCDSLNRNELRRLQNFCSQHDLHDVGLGPTRQAAQLDHILLPDDSSFKWWAEAFLNFYSDHKAIVLRLSENALDVPR